MIMEIKKSPRADLESMRPLFTEIGAAVALTAALVAFEWSKADVTITRYEAPTDAPVIEEMLPIITEEDIVKPELPPPPPPVTDVIEIVTDDTEDIDDIFVPESDANTIDFAIPEAAPVEEPEDDDVVCEIFSVERQPEFPGGNAALMRYLANEVHYPVIAADNGIQGRVYVKFVVDKQGNVTDIRVARSVDPQLDKEALRVIGKMPQWSPGIVKGRPVKVAYTVPINFVLK